MIPPTKKSKGSRDSHRELHKRCEYTQDYFHTIWGNDLMYPGDTSAPAREVCNCHCVYIEHVLGPSEEIEDGKVVRYTETMQREALMDKGFDDIIKGTEDLYARGSEERLISIPEGFENNSKYRSTNEIVEHFKWVDQYKQTHSPIDTESWMKATLEQQNAIANGLDYAVKTFKLKHLPEKVIFDNLPNGKFGSYGGGILRISYGTKGLPKTNFATAFHEMVHYIDSGAKTRSTDIINKATRELGIRKNSNKYLNFVLSITNQSSLTAYATDPREILAFSLESEATKRPLNEMAQKVVDIFWREYGK